MSGTRGTRPKGTNDFVPPESERKARFEAEFRRLAGTYGFRGIVTPVFEHTEVFVKSSGAASDIVTKEMYTFTDRGGRDLTLRPEGTPGVVRAVLENGLRTPARFYYLGPCFRYSRPQKGRYREFHQLGVEVIGEASPLVDSEVISLGAEFFRAVGITDCRMMVNSIGCVQCRPGYREKLVGFLSGSRDELCEDCRVRLERNPLRVFDCKNESCKRIVIDAPRPIGSLCPACRAHFDAVLADLARRGLPFELNELLARGLDYYNRTTFEYISGSLGAQDSLGGGGRYDYLVQEFGGPDTPAIGFALGLDRTLLAAPAAESSRRRRLAYVVWFSPEEIPAALALADELRKAGIATQLDHDAAAPEHAKKFKRQVRTADAAGAACCVIVGPDELARNVFSLKNLDTGEQAEVPVAAIATAVRDLLES